MYDKYQNFRQRRTESRQREAGIRYENFIAQTLRQEGWEVTENGHTGMPDHGIDLIASKEGVRRYIQCKGWKRNKFIHEDVVSHLYGSVAAIEGPDNLLGVELYIYSPAQLDSYAGAEAEKLNIHLVRLDFPAEMLMHRYYRHFRKRSVSHS
jgi:hypothetical protein